MFNLQAGGYWLHRTRARQSGSPVREGTVSGRGHGCRSRKARAMERFGNHLQNPIAFAMGVRRTIFLRSRPGGAYARPGAGGVAGAGDVRHRGSGQKRYQQKLSHTGLTLVCCNVPPDASARDGERRRSGYITLLMRRLLEERIVATPADVPHSGTRRAPVWISPSGDGGT